jgi:hypothetical protein
MAAHTVCRSGVLKELCFLTLISVLSLTGCAGSASVSDRTPRVRPVPVYLDAMPREVPHELLNYYACLNQQPLMCECGSRLATHCQCRCPF